MSEAFISPRVHAQLLKALRQVNSGLVQGEVIDLGNLRLRAEKLEPPTLDPRPMEEALQPLLGVIDACRLLQDHAGHYLNAYSQTLGEALGLRIAPRLLHYVDLYRDYYNHDPSDLGVLVVNLTESIVRSMLNSRMGDERHYPVDVVGVFNAATAHAEDRTVTLYLSITIGLDEQDSSGTPRLRIPARMDLRR